MTAWDSILRVAGKVYSKHTSALVRKKSGRSYIAYHEAGHALMAYAFGIPTISARVEPWFTVHIGEAVGTCTSIRQAFGLLDCAAINIAGPAADRVRATSDGWPPDCSYRTLVQRQVENGGDLWHYLQVQPKGDNMALAVAVEIWMTAHVRLLDEIAMLIMKRPITQSDLVRICGTLPNPEETLRRYMGIVRLDRKLDAPSQEAA